MRIAPAYFAHGPSMVVCFGRRWHRMNGLFLCLFDRFFDFLWIRFHLSASHRRLVDDIMTG
jgi:hypothetical protein